MLGWSQGVRSSKTKFSSKFKLIRWNSETAENFLGCRAEHCKIIDYTKEDITEKGGKYDYVFDTVGKSTFGKCKSLLNKKGIYISSELGPYSQNIFYPLFTSMSSKKVIFPIPYNKRETIPYISKNLEKGTFKPVIDREYLLEDISKAYEYVIKGQKTGSVLINLNNESTTKPKLH